MKHIDEIMKQKAESLDLGRGDQLAEIQEVLNGIYPGRVRAKQLQNGVLTITTPSSAVASDLRLQQVYVLKKIKNNKNNVSIMRIKISV